MTDTAALIKRANEHRKVCLHLGLDTKILIGKLTEALSRLTVPPLQDRTKAIAKMLRERIPLILDFGTQRAAFIIMAGVEDLARDVLALAVPAASPPEEIAGLIKQLSKISINDCYVMGKAAAALRSQAAEIERLKDDLRRTRSVYDFAAQEKRIRELEAERALIPGGTHCDPQEIADSIRGLAQSPENEKKE